MLRKIVLILFVSICSLNAAAVDYTSQCDVFPAPLKGGYCINIPNSDDMSNDVLYYLHGKNGDEHLWMDPYYYVRQMRDHWSETKQAAPLVISISFGPLWVLAEKNTSPVSGLFEVVTQQLIPMIEKKIGGVRGRRLLMGESMGGFNSLQLALKTNLFAKAALLCVPMASISPFSSPEQIDTYIKSSYAWQYYKDSAPDQVIGGVNEMVQVSKMVFPTDSEWANGSPLGLAEKLSENYKTKLYIAIGFYDRYAAYEANQKFVKILKSKGVDVEWRAQWGGHCAMDIPSLADFITK